jgi:DNA repair exonuclease SbcCD ATPase subunit
VDRDAIAREQRRRQALEALEFERDRATSLEEQVEAIVAELEGPRIDQEAFARMAPEDVDAVRAVLQPDDGPGPDEEWLGLEGESLEADPSETDHETAEEVEAELERLQQELAASHRRRDVLERYIEALGG